MRHPVVEEDLAGIAASRLPFRELAGQTALVTGAAGFLPAYIVEALLYLNETRGLGVRVVGLVRDLSKARRRFARYRGRKDLRFVIADASRPPRLDGPLHRILHAASQASPRYYGPDPVGTLAPNVLGTARLLELARVKRASLLYFSSAEVYGRLPASVRRIREGDFGSLDPLDPRSCYSEAKRMGETLCAAWLRQHGVPVRVVRPFHTYGPGMALDDGRVFSDFAADIVGGRNITVRGDGSAVRAYCYLADAAAGCLAVLLKGSPGSAYNVGNDRAAVSVSALARRLTRLFPEKRLQVIRKPRAKASGYLPSPLARLCPDASRLRALGWTPKHGIESGFSRTVRYYS